VLFHSSLRSRTIKVCPDETYISDDVCSSIIYESKRAVNRCKEVNTTFQIRKSVTIIFLQLEIIFEIMWHLFRHSLNTKNNICYLFMLHISGIF